MKNFLYLIIIITLFSCKKDIEDGRVINGTLNANIPEYWAINNVFNGIASATISNGDLFIRSEQRTTHEGGDYDIECKITLQLKLEGNPIANKTYLLFNDSAQYGKGVLNIVDHEYDVGGFRFYSTGYYPLYLIDPFSSEKLNGSVLITSIDNNKISGTFSFGAYQYMPSRQSWCCDSVTNGIFTDVLID